jgi:hypothetical protein
MAGIRLGGDPRRVIPDAVWFGRPWGAVGKHLGDALIYSLLTAGIFGWLWPG